MKVTGSYTLAAPRSDVWHALQDPAVLARTLPGCQQLEVTGADAYAATITAGVASVKGTYHGKVELTDKQEPGSYRMHAQGAGAPGTVSADAWVRLEENGTGTTVRYDADAIVGGMIGGVGQRMLVGVARKTADEFFAAVERELTGAPAAAPAGAEGRPGAGATPEAAVVPQVGQVFSGVPSTTGASKVELLVAAVLGAAVALLGVLVGRRTARS